jgi:hypothetical protein
MVANLAQERAAEIADRAEAIVADRAAGFDVAVWVETLRETAECCIWLRWRMGWRCAGRE